VIRLDRPTYRPDPAVVGRGPGADVLVALSVKDGERFLASAIESVLAQVQVDLRLEIYDNGSTDRTIEIARGYEAADPRVRVVVNPPGYNYFCSMNRAVAGSTAQFFCPWACDDLMEPDNLVQKIAALVEHPDAGFAWSPTLIMDDHDRIADFFPDVGDVEPYLPAPDFMDVLLPVGEVVMSSVVMRTSAIRQIGGFDPRTTLVGDWLTWMRMAMRFGVVTIPYALVSYRQHEECGSYRAKDGRMALEGPAVLREALADPLFPAALRTRADLFMAQVLVNEMWGLTNREILRYGDGYAAYGLAAQALCLVPQDANVHRAYRRLVEAADLTVPNLPASLAGRPDPTPEGITRLLREFARMRSAGVAERLTVALPPHIELPREAVTPVVAGAVDVSTADLADILRPGMGFLGPWGAADLAASEGLGVPAFVYDLPDCFDRPRDRERWETLEGPSTLCE
jgi:glycosyltransferase involved in cell wall biosynthesis